MERWWSGLPEVVRWVLFLPAVLVVLVALNLLQMIGLFLFGRAGTFWVMVAQAAFSASILFPIVFELAPRGKKIAGWFFYVPAMALCGLALVLLIARRLAMWGLLGASLLPPPGEVWTVRDWGELAQAAVWLGVGSYSFRACLRDYARSVGGVQVANRAGLTVHTPE